MMRNWRRQSQPTSGNQSHTDPNPPPYSQRIGPPRQVNSKDQRLLSSTLSLNPTLSDFLDTGSQSTLDVPHVKVTAAGRSYIYHDSTPVVEDQQLDGDVCIYGPSVISGTVDTSGNFSIWGRTKMSGSVFAEEVIISEDANVTGEVQAKSNLYIIENSKVSGDLLTLKNAKIINHSQVTGQVSVHGNLRVSGYARVSGDVEVRGKVIVEGFARLTGRVIAGGGLRVLGKAYVADYAENLCVEKKKDGEHAGLDGGRSPTSLGVEGSKSELEKERDE